MSRRLCFTLPDGTILVQPVGDIHEVPHVRYEVPRWRGDAPADVVKQLRNLASAIETFDGSWGET